MRTGGGFTSVHEFFLEFEARERMYETMINRKSVGSSPSPKKKSKGKKSSPSKKQRGTIDSKQSRYE